MEKMVLLSKALNVSLDYLISGEDQRPGPQKQWQGAIPTGKIMIKTQDGKGIVNCYKVLSSPIYKSRKGEPKYALFGVDGVSFWGENTTLLGWYADEEGIRKELDAILLALNNGEPSYELKHAAKVKSRFFSIRLEDE